MRAEHKDGILVLSALNAGNIAVTIDFDLIDGGAQTIARVSDKRLLEPGNAVQSQEIAQRFPQFSLCPISLARL
jgi:hypothetical protein